MDSSGLRLRAQHGGVGEVALPARDRQLLGRMPQQRIGDAEIALGILEVDRVHLVRHGRGADFAGDRALAEIAQRDVAPEVAAQVDEHRVAARERVAVLGDPVVRLDLGRVGVALEAERFHEAARDAAASRPPGRRRRARCSCRPRRSTCRGSYARERARGARSRCTNLATSLPSVVGVAGWPWVRDSIGVVRVLMRHGAQRCRVSASSRAAARASRALAQHQRVGEVVDVLRRAAEVHEFEPRVPGRSSRRASRCTKYSTALTSWLVCSLDRLDGRGILRRSKSVDQAVERVSAARPLWKFWSPGTLCRGACSQAHFDPDPGSDQTRLR